MLVVLLAAAFSQPALAQTGDAPGKPTMVMVSAVAGDASKLHVTWTPPPAPDPPIDYYVFRYWPMGETFCGTECEQNSGRSATTSWTLVHLYAGTTYNVQVLARNAVGTGPASDVVTATTGLPAIRIGWQVRDTIPEGEAGLFSIAADHFVSAPLTVNLNISTARVSGVSSGPTTVTIPARGRFVDYRIQTTNDQAREGDGTVTAEVVDGTGYRLGSQTSATITVVDYDQERSVPENSPPGTPVGAPFNVRDDDRSTHSVTLGGPDKDSFDISWPMNRPSVIPIQILTRAGVVYDYEAKNLYVVTITVTNPAGSGQARVLIRLTDVNETPPEISIEPVRASIRAGEEAQFRLVASTATFQRLHVGLQLVGTSGSVSRLSSARVTVERGRTAAVHTESTTNEDVGSITARIRSGPGYTVAAAPGDQAVVEVGHGSAKPVVRIRAEAAGIVEGAEAVFTVTAEPAPLSDLSVSLRLHETGEFGVVEKRPPGGRLPLPSVRVVNLLVLAGQTTVTHRVRTTDDEVDEPNGQVSGQISCERSACEIDFANDLARVKINDNDGGPEVHVSVDGSVTEGGTVMFRATTDPPGVSLNNVRFRYTVRGGDFGARTLPNGDVIPRGETGSIQAHTLQNGTRDIPVYTTDDEVDEPYGQVTVKLLPGDGYQLRGTSDVFATADIYDDDGPPPPPSRPWWELEADSRLKILWEAIPDANAYSVRWGIATEPSRQTARVTAPEFTTPALSPGVEHAFEVSACNDAGCSEPSPEVQGSVEREAPADWASPNFRAVDGSPPLIHWDAYPDATGYTVEFTAPISWTGRKDNGYAEMSNEGPEYTMRAKAHGDGWETEWTDWFNTCRPPYAHQGEPNTPPDCVESTGSTETPPEADAGPDIEGKRGEENIVLAGSGTAHAEGSQTLSYGWRFADASHAELVSMITFLSGADSAQATFTVPRRRDMADRSALDDGNWIDFELTVTDGDGESASDTARLTINGTTWQPTSLTFDAPNESGFTLAGPMEMGEPVANLVEGQSYELTVTAATAVDAATEIAIMRDAMMSDADEGDYEVASVMIAAGATSGATMLTITEDGMPDAGRGDPEMLVLYGMVDGVQTNSMAFMLWDMAVPALPLIAQLVLAGLLAVGGVRRYRRR